MEFIFFMVGFLASAAGSICGIGGGVIIKPVLDMLHLASVSTISFLSGCTVLSMSCYSVGKSILAGEQIVDRKTAFPLAVGAALGGITGAQIFRTVSAAFQNQNRVGAVQSACLMAITFGTLIYTIFKEKLPSYKITSSWSCLLIGFTLGMISSFLGIGGGPINLVVLYFFFRMETKTAAANSLYIILFSQSASLLRTLLTGSVPKFEIVTLAAIVAGGIAGGAAGRGINRKISNSSVEILFISLMAVIICISAYNVWRYTFL